MQVFSDRVNLSRCCSIRSPLIPCAACNLLHDVLWMIMHHQKWSGRDEYLHKHTGAAFRPCGSMWLRIITKSFNSSCLWNDHDCSGKTDDNQNLTALACQKDSALLLSFELDLVVLPDNWFEYSSKHQEKIRFSKAALPPQKTFFLLPWPSDIVYTCAYGMSFYFGLWKYHIKWNLRYKFPPK